MAAPKYLRVEMSHRPLDRRRRLTLIVFALICVSQPFVLSSYGAYTVIVQQIGNNVVATGSGSLDVDGLTPNTTGTDRARFWASYPLVILGPTTFSNFDWYIGSIKGPSTLGGGSEFVASAGTGLLVGFAAGYSMSLVIPVGYVSGAFLGISTATWNNASFASLGLAAGTYIYSWGSGQHADTFTVQIGTPAAVPESSSTVSLLAIALMCLRLLYRNEKASPRKGRLQAETLDASLEKLREVVRR